MRSVPQSARSPRPIRTPSELLAEARAATAGWSDGELTAEAIRKAVHTSAANARTLRGAIKAERAERPDTNDVDGPDTPEPAPAPLADVVDNES